MNWHFASIPFVDPAYGEHVGVFVRAAAVFMP